MTPRIAILSTRDNVIGFMDNAIPEALHYYDDALHIFLQGQSYTFAFKCLSQHPMSAELKEGRKLAFRFDDKDYYLNIMRVIRDDTTTEILAYGLSFELLLEDVDKEEAVNADFVSYYNGMSFEKAHIELRQRINTEVKCLKFDSRSSILKRLYDAADQFGIELKFTSKLTNNYGLEKIIIDMHEKGRRKGIGQDRTGEKIRYGREIRGIKKTADLTDFCSGIRPQGKKVTLRTKEQTVEHYDDTGKLIKTVKTITHTEPEKTETRTITTIGNYVETRVNTTIKHENGVTERHDETFTNGVEKPSRVPTGTTQKTIPGKDVEEDFTLSLHGMQASKTDEDGTYMVIGDDVRCPVSRDRFPSDLKLNSTGNIEDGYLIRFVDYSDCEDQGEMFNRAVEELKKHCFPKLTYEVSGYLSGEVGDWFTIVDTQYHPTLYVECRIVEQEICFTNPARSATKFDNFTELQSEISSTAVVRQEELKQALSGFSGYITTSNGNIIKNGEGSTTLRANVTQYSKEVDYSKYLITWLKDGNEAGSGREFHVTADSITNKSVFTFRATDTIGRVVAQSEITVTELADGSSPSVGVVDGTDSTTITIKDKENESAAVIPKGATFTPAVSEDGILSWSNDMGKPNPSPVKVTGADGRDGVTFTPSVSSSGVLSWTNDGGLSNPAAANIKGKDGKDGTNGAPGKKGEKGEPGTPGADGRDGVGVSSVSARYYQSSSSSAPSQTSSSWSTTMPSSLTAGYYLHTQIRVYLTNGSVQYYYTKSRNGTNGSSSSVSVVNNLTSTSTTSALSANQGRILSERLRTPQTGWYQKILYDTNNLTCVYIRSWGKGPNAVVTGDISFGSSKPNTPGTTYTYNTGFKFQSATVAANVPFGRDGSGMAHVKIQFDGTITVRIVATSTATGGTIGDSTLYWALPVLVDTYPD